MFWNSDPKRRFLIQENGMNATTFETSADVMRAAQQMIEDAGEGASVKERLRTAARKLGITYGLAKRIRNNEIKQPATDAFMRMLKRYGAVLEQLERQSSENTARYRARLQAWGSHETAAANGAAGPAMDR